MIDRKKVRRKRIALGFQMDKLEERIARGEVVDQKEFDRIRNEFYEMARAKGQETDIGKTGVPRKQKTAAEAGLTAIVYLVLKDQRKKDSEIREAWDVSEKSLKRMKNANGLQGFANKPLLATTREAKISAEIKQLAESNNIDIKTLVRRIFEHNWNEMKAATEPILNGGRNKKVGN